MEKFGKQGVSSKWRIIVLAGVISILLTFCGKYYYNYEARLIRTEKYESLSGIGTIKAEQISEWYEDEIFDVKSISLRALLVEKIKNWFKSNSPASRTELKNYFTELAAVHGYDDLFICLPDGKIKYSLGEKVTQLNEISLEYVKESVRNRSVLSTDLYRCTHCKDVQIDFISPFLDEDQNVIAVFVARIDPNNYLYPLIQRWPTPSKTSETLIIRRDQDSVVFLNELRHVSGTALNLRISLDEKKVPAVQAVLGYEGIWEGIDYRGMEVIAQILPIKGPDWYMISKVDSEEIFSELKYRSTVIILFVLLAIGASSLGLSLFYKNRQSKIFKRLYLKETQLAEKEEEYKTTLYSIGDGVITTDIEGKVKQMNPVAENHTGWKEAEARGVPLSEVFDIYNEYTGEVVENPVNKVLKDGLIIGLANHTVLKSRQGTLVPIADSGAPIRNEDGDVIGVVLVFRDQTAERDAENKLKESEESLRNAQEQGKLGSWVLPIVNGKGRWSRQMYRLFNQDPDCEVPDIETYLKLIHPEDRSRLEKTLNQLFKGIDPEIKEYRTNPDLGPVKYLMPTYKCIKDDDGKPLRYEGTLLDITELKLTELALKESEEIFKHFMERSPVYIFFKDKNLRSIRLSRNYEKMLGRPLDELLGKSMYELFPTELAAGIEADDRRIMEEGRLVEVEEQLNGRHYSTVKFPIMIEGKPEYLAGFTIDITERKRMIEELIEAKNDAEKADKLKFEFLAQMSHEIRTPLNTVLNYTSLLRDEFASKFSEEIEQIFNSIDSASKRVIRTIDLILNISQITTDAYDFVARKVDLYKDIILEVEKELKQTAYLKGLSLTVDNLADNTIMFVDEYSVSQIFINLVENAIKYTKSGAINIRLITDESDRIKVEVADTGIGINGDFLDNLFTPFSQEETGYTRRYEGTGLGLHLVKKYCEMNNAEIVVSSIKNKGSVFTVLFNKV